MLLFALVEQSHWEIYQRPPRNQFSHVFWLQVNPSREVFSPPYLKDKEKLRSHHGQQERGCPPKDHYGLRWLQRA